MTTRGTCFLCGCRDAVVDTICPNCGQVTQDVENPETDLFRSFHVLKSRWCVERKSGDFLPADFKTR